MTVPQKQVICRLGFIILLIAALYGTTLQHGFVWDDTYIIVNNPLLESVHNLPQFFLSEDTIEESTGYYRPVTYISFALERALWGINPAGYHGTNLVLHILVVLLFYAVIAALFKKERLAFVAALLLALHPLAGETVNFLAGGRNTLLSACFGLLSLLFYIRNRPLAALVSFTLAIFSKEFALLLPAIFILYDLRLERKGFRVSRYAPYLIPIAGYLTLRSYAVQKANFLEAINLADSMKAPYLVVRYVLNMVAPLRLKVLYSVTPDMPAILLSLGLLGIAAATLYYFRKHDEIIFGTTWTILFLLPVINIIPLHTITVLADRYAYFSLMGCTLLLSTAICMLNGRVLATVVASLCLLYVVIGFRNTAAWKNDFTFFTRMTVDAPECFAGFKNLGMSYYRTGEIARAFESLEIGESKADIPVKYLIGDAYLFWKENRLDKAEKSLLRVVGVNPSNPEPYLMLMMISEQKGDHAAARIYRNTLQGMVGSIDDMITQRAFELSRTGETFLSKGQIVDAEIYLWQALRTSPAYIPALIDMGNLRAGQDKPAEAIPYFNKVLDLEPENASALYNLAEVYRMQGKHAEAERTLIKFREAEARAKH